MDFALLITNSFAEVERLGRSVSAFLDPRGIPPRARYAVDLVLEEIVTNIIKYAYADGTRHEISIRLSLEPGFIDLEIEDDGRPFDPLSAATPDPTVPVADRPEGGYGIHLVRAFAQEIRYRREGNFNHLAVRLALDTPA